MNYVLRLFPIFLFFLVQVCTGAVEKKPEPKRYGLKFLAHDVNQDQRTGLDLTGDKDLSFPADGFSIAFDVKLRMEYHTYGYIFRVIAQDQSSFDLVSNLLQRKMNFILNNQKKIMESQELIDSALLTPERWLPVEVTFRPTQIQLKIGRYRTALSHSFRDFNHIKIYFGFNRHLDYYTADVPPMTVRNIVIKSKGEVIRSWKLAYHNRTEVLDDVHGSRAQVVNGSWEIDKHAHWEKVASLPLANQQPQVAFDSIGGRIFAATANKVYTFHLDGKHTDSTVVSKGNPYPGVSRQLIYDPISHRLISYTHMFPQLDTYDFQTNQWSLAPQIIIDSKQHHNHLIDRQRNKLVMLMGYGYHQYDGTLLETSLSGSSSWQQKALDPPIPPRYLAALGVEDNHHVLLLGGHGSISGKQEESPRNFYDLHRIDLLTGKTTKLWAFTNDREHYTFSNSMVIDKEKNKLYALAYNNDRYHSKIYLYAFDVNTKQPTPSVMSDSIPYHFLDVKSYCDLFLYAKTSTLYAVVSHEVQQGQQMLEIYALAFPPIPESSIAQGGRAGQYVHLLTWIGCLFLFLVISSVIFLLHRKKPIPMATPPQISPPNERQAEGPQDVRYPAILLMGGFQVFAKDGENTTAAFTPIVRNIFLMLLFYTLKDQKGTTSQQLDETFWSDMDHAKALNNRSVNVRKLRVLLKSLGKAGIDNKNGYWKLQIDPDVWCDYQETMQVLHQVKQQKSATIDQLVRLVALAKDELLPDISAEWLDRFKSAYVTLLVETLLKAISQPDVQANRGLVLNIIDVILVHDCLEESAIQLKCRILYEAGQKGLSKQAFDKFYADYKRILDAVPDFTYEDLISN